MRNLVKILFLFALLFTACSKDNSPKPKVITKLLPNTLYNLTNPVKKTGADSVQLNLTAGRLGGNLVYFPSLSKEVGAVKDGKIFVNYQSGSYSSSILQITYNYEIKDGRISFSLFFASETSRQNFDEVYSWSNINRDHINATVNYSWDITLFERTF